MTKTLDKMEASKSHKKDCGFQAIIRSPATCKAAGQPQRRDSGCFAAYIAHLGPGFAAHVPVQSNRGREQERREKQQQRNDARHARHRLQHPPQTGAIGHGVRQGICDAIQTIMCSSIRNTKCKSQRELTERASDVLMRSEYFFLRCRCMVCAWGASQNHKIRYRVIGTTLPKPFQHCVFICGF